MEELAEPPSHIIDGGSDFRIGIAIAKSGHEFLAKHRVKVCALQEHLRCIGARWVIDRSHAEIRTATKPARLTFYAVAFS